MKYTINISGYFAYLANSDSSSTFHVQKTVKVGQADTAIDWIPPVGKFIICIKPGVKIFFTVFKLHKKGKKGHNLSGKSLDQVGLEDSS